MVVQTCKPNAAVSCDVLVKSTTRFRPVLGAVKAIFSYNSTGKAQRGPSIRISIISFI